MRRGSGSVGNSTIRKTGNVHNPSFWQECRRESDTFHICDGNVRLFGWTYRGCPYLEIAEWLSRYSVQATANLVQMWQRIVFNIAISNCDDHLQNYGFLLTKKGWRLSLAYDLNLSYCGGELSLNITENDNSLDMDLAREVALFFGVAEKETEAIIDKVCEVVSSWRRVASRLGIAREEHDMMAKAFGE